jgi:autophagy-related protein 17
MASPSAQPDSQSLVALVLVSKKALQHGESLCARAHALAGSSAQTAIDTLALDAHLRWIGGVVGEQFKVCFNYSVVLISCSYVTMN